MKTLILSLTILISCSKNTKQNSSDEMKNKIVVSFDKAESEKLIHEKEVHFKNLKQLTNGGENAEAYFDFSYQKIIFQSKRDGAKYDAIYEMNINGDNVRPLSSGKGVTTCSYFLPDGKSYVYASTHEFDGQLNDPDRSKGYVWPLYKQFDIFQAEYPSNKIIKKLTTTDRYDAEATVSPKGDKILFTSLRDGDMEIYIMDIDGSNQKRLTHMPGFDGGPFFNWDASQIVWRGSHPESEEELAEQKRLQDEDLMTPVNLDIYVMNPDGTNIRRVTNNKSANFGPFFHPDNKRIIFSSNYDQEIPYEFDLWMVNNDGSNLKRITYAKSFDGFPIFSKDAKYIVFGSNRNNHEGTRDTNVFIGEWID